MLGELIAYEIKERIEKEYPSLEAEYGQLRNDLLNCLNENGNLKREYPEDYRKEHEILIKLPSV